MSYIYIYIHIIYTSYYIPRDVLITWQSSTTWWRTTHAIRLHGLVHPSESAGGILLEFLGIPSPVHIQHPLNETMF